MDIAKEIIIDRIGSIPVIDVERQRALKTPDQSFTCLTLFITDIHPNNLHLNISPWLLWAKI